MPRSLNQSRQIIFIAHDIRSIHNVGSLFRTADGLAINELVLTGYTPYPKIDDDDRLPHLAAKITKQIAKTALGAEKTLKWRRATDIYSVLKALKTAGYTIYALEQAKVSTDLTNLKPSEKVAVIIGNELTGLSQQILASCDEVIEIPMLGQKESFNVVQAAAMAMFYLRLIA